ncbi:Multidrug resistance protein MdtA [Fundidesulfovibrio magnetotacticus]|uniref:Multidrug resistance protein MdtA n=1 Tax=Fundidesulfovibrio magnetotacticus TaxID=2730080 RepID=A0A6V8LY17_9BACT|nr:efflux RND transporter periplasmic adaptor subunit [Fundidesulfovibrio magnetotacticus]GFK95491.1 Multidrug resistance protein MdtA [Fundidesulfovibrio magnetotacticus]
MKLRLSLLVSLGLCLCLAFAAGCSDGKKQQQGQGRRAVPVTVAEATLGSLPVSLTAVGNVEPYQSAAVRTQVGGLIVEQRVRDGQEVAAGDVLFVLDQRPFQAALKEAQGKLERDQALLKKAEDDFNRYSGLKQKDVVSQQQFDQASTDAKSLRASIKLSEAQIEQARLQMDYSVIKAPFAGRVGTVLVNVGNVIKANDDRNLLVLNQVQPIYVSFALPEQHLPAVTAHMGKAPLEVLAAVAGEESRPEKGVLASVDNSVDRATGTIKLKGLFANKDKRLWPGQFAKVTLNLESREGVLTAPSAAVQQGLQGPFVYVVGQDNTAALRPVETGQIVGERMVILKGLAAGDKVVTDGHVRLTPGAAVEIKAVRDAQDAVLAPKDSKAAQDAKDAKAAPGSKDAKAAPGSKDAKASGEKAQ